MQINLYQGKGENYIEIDIPSDEVAKLIVGEIIHKEMYILGNKYLISIKQS